MSALPADTVRPIVEVVVGLVERAGGSELLLVRQHRPGRAEAYWELPGGRVEPGEALADAVIRELREETGLVVTNAGNMLFTIAHESATRTLAGFIFEVGRWDGDLAPNDPEALILDARFLPRAEAIAELERIPWRFMSEPTVKYLRGEIPAGATWHYADRPDGTTHLVSCDLGDRTVLRDDRISSRAAILLLSLLGLAIGGSLWCTFGMLGGV
jgi:8-oxo-dGTP diphosphatase